MIASILKGRLCLPFRSVFACMEPPTDAEELNLCILYHAHLPKKLTCLPVSPNCRDTHMAELLGLVPSDWPEVLHL